MVKTGLDITKQCPQLYAYIFSILTAILLTLKLQPKQAPRVIVVGAINTVLLMGINFCDWHFQWLTWLIASFSILASAVFLAVFIDGKSLKNEQEVTE